MSTGVQPTQPSNDQNPPTDVSTSATAPVSEAVQSIVDVDDADLQAAIAAAQAEDANAGGQQAVGSETMPAAPAAPAAPQGQTEPQGSPMIPKARFDEVNTQRTEAERRAAYLQGQLDAIKSAPPAAPATQQPAPQVTPQQQLGAIANATEALAKRFDDGEITMAEFKREERNLQTQERAIHDAMRAPVQTPASNADGNELYLETLTAQLEEQHPWVAVFDQVGSKADWEYLKQTAAESLAARGVDLSKKSALATYELRKELATIADQLGPTLVAAKAQAKGIQLPGTQTQQQQKPPQGQQQQQLSPAAKARQAGLDKLANAAPDISSLNGYTGEAGGLPTEDSLAGMDEDMIGNLPASMRAKLRGVA